MTSVVAVVRIVFRIIGSNGEWSWMMFNLKVRRCLRGTSRRIDLLHIVRNDQQKRVGSFKSIRGIISASILTCIACLIN